MTPELWQRVKEIVIKVQESAPADRQSFIAQVCEGDPRLRREVESLLRYEDEGDRTPESQLTGQELFAFEELTQREIGPYYIEALLGRGGMGEVFKAWDQRLKRWVVLKRLNSSPQQSSSMRSRFLREARSAAQLSHPAIVQVFDILEDDDAWIVMELIPGPTLIEVLQDGPLDIGLTLEYGRQVALGLAAAHRGGVVHRDLKTENVMVVHSEGDHPGQIKIVDFGLAKREAAAALDSTAPAISASDEETRISVSGQIMGTPRAMSPEHAQGKKIDARSDLFSLGVLLYELSTGRSPFKAAIHLRTLRRVIEHHQPPARKLRPQVPQALSDLIDRLLEKEPEKRPQSARAVAESLAQIAARDSLYPHSLIEPKPSLVKSDRLLEEVMIRTLLVSELIDSTLWNDGGQQVDLRERHDRVVYDLLATHGGREVGVAKAGPVSVERFKKFLIFDRPWAAICYALEYHRAVRESSNEMFRESCNDLNSAAPLAARIGIHLGEIFLHHSLVIDADSSIELLEGSAQQLASRLMALGRRGQTLLSRATFEVARRGEARKELEALEWRAYGRYRFKGLAQDVEIFEVGISAVAPLQAPLRSSEARSLESSTWQEVSKDALLDSQRPAVLREWPPPELPEQPYPVLLPYTHPALLAGREQEIADLRRLLRMPVLILSLTATSGAGKTSLLLGGLVPALRADGIPVAMTRHPSEAGIAQRLIGDLLEDGSSSSERSEAKNQWVGAEDWRGFVERLLDVERLAGEAAVLVLDQFEDVLRPEADAARAVLGVLLAATALRRPGIDEAPCRWLLACRQEFHGRLVAWLGDVLGEAQRLAATTTQELNFQFEEIDALPHDLLSPERFHSMSLPMLATPSPGSDGLKEATQVFRTAIEKPLELTELGDSEERALYPWRFAPGHAERLARAFAEARIARPEAPLTPELQVVLAELLSRASRDPSLQERSSGDSQACLTLIEVPDDPASLIDRALETHLRRALVVAFPADLRGTGSDAQMSRSRALLALRELACTEHRRTGLSIAALSRAIGANGEEVIEQLATSLTRLVVAQEHPDGWRYVLAHDRMAEVVIGLVEEEGQCGGLLIDAELLALRRIVAIKTALYRSQKEHANNSSPSWRSRVGTKLSWRHRRLIESHAEAFLWDDERRVWWAACCHRRRTSRQRTAFLTVLAGIFLILLAWGTWFQARLQAEHQALLKQLVQGEPVAALQALNRLMTAPGADFAELRSRIKQREIPMDVLERGLSGVSDDERSAVVLRVVEFALPWVEETPDNPELIANLVWSLDLSLAHDEQFAGLASKLRDRVLAPLRELQPPPFTASDDPNWVEIPEGEFLMGIRDNQEGQGDERPQHKVTVSAFRLQRHEVTNAEYRLLVLDHEGEDALPVADISWYGAYTYAAWLGGRLPTEAEWEYAARASCIFEYCNRNGNETMIDEVAWILRNSRNLRDYELSPQPVMRLESNPWGLFDMLGNLWEWTADWYSDYPVDPQHDPWVHAAPSGSVRVIRGGAYDGLPEAIRVENRGTCNPGSKIEKISFRVVLPN